MHNLSSLGGVSPRRHRLAYAPLALLMTTGCLLNENGSTFGGSNVGREINFEGFASVSNEQVRVQVLDPANQVVSAGATWTTIATVNASATPTDVNGTNMYYYTAEATPVPNNGEANRWRPGGLARFRVLRGNGAGVPLTTFDDFDCVMDQVSSGATPVQIEAACESHASPFVTFVDRDPISANAVDYLSLRGTPGEGDDYALQIAALDPDFPNTLTEFRDTRGFPSGQVVARYYNKGDLGIGREMHCRSNNDVFVAGAPLVACYVSNYGNVTDGLADQNTALADAIAGHAPFATVAMDYWPGTDQPVRFYTYDADGDLIFDAALDSEGPKSVPGLCMGCHGGTYDTTFNRITGARFLPFDLNAFGYANSGSYTRPNQEEEFRNLNRIVKVTAPGSSMTNIINGWYGGAAGVTTPGTTQNSEYVPSGWTGKEDVYLKAVAPYCRTCHIALATKIDTFTQLQNLNLGQSFVCDSHIMPHAEVTREAFWKSSARAHLAGSLGWANDCD
jgi:hypothetical protein